jgi:hypothetical protein
MYIVGSQLVDQLEIVLWNRLNAWFIRPQAFVRQNSFFGKMSVWPAIKTESRVSGHRNVKSHTAVNWDEVRFACEHTINVARSAWTVICMSLSSTCEYTREIEGQMLWSVRVQFEGMVCGGRKRLSNQTPSSAYARASEMGDVSYHHGATIMCKCKRGKGN